MPPKLCQIEKRTSGPDGLPVELVPKFTLLYCLKCTILARRRAQPDGIKQNLFQKASKLLEKLLLLLLHKVMREIGNLLLINKCLNTICHFMLENAMSKSVESKADSLSKQVLQFVIIPNFFITLKYFPDFLK